MSNRHYAVDNHQMNWFFVITEIFVYIQQRNSAEEDIIYPERGMARHLYRGLYSTATGLDSEDYASMNHQVKHTSDSNTNVINDNAAIHKHSTK